MFLSVTWQYSTHWSRQPLSHAWAALREHQVRFLSHASSHTLLLALRLLVSTSNSEQINQYKNNVQWLKYFSKMIEKLWPSLFDLFRGLLICITRSSYLAPTSHARCLCLPSSISYLSSSLLRFSHLGHLGFFRCK